MATAVIKLSRFDVNADSNKPAKVTAELLQTLPKSKYAARPDEALSDNTEIYWPLDVGSDKLLRGLPGIKYMHSHLSDWQILVLVCMGSGR